MLKIRTIKTASGAVQIIIHIGSAKTSDEVVALTQQDFIVAHTQQASMFAESRQKVLFADGSQCIKISHRFARYFLLCWLKKNGEWLQCEFQPHHIVVHPVGADGNIFFADNAETNFFIK